MTQRDPEDGFDPETEDVGLYHPDAPLDGEEWFFNVGRIETSGDFAGLGRCAGQYLLCSATSRHPPIQQGSSCVLGDFNCDGLLTEIDINMLTAQVRSGEHDISYDLNADAQVTDADRTVWVEDLKHTYFGDANLDGEFGSADLVRVFIAGEYEDGVPDNSLWETGDWTGDGEFSSSDFVKAFVGGGYEKGLRTDAVAIPEPSGLTLLLLALIGFVRRSRAGRCA